MSLTVKNFGGGSPKLTGNATPGNVLSGKTFYSNDAKTRLTGTLVKPSYNNWFNWSDVQWGSRTYDASTMIPIVARVQLSGGGNGGEYKWGEFLRVTYGGTQIYDMTMNGDSNTLRTWVSGGWADIFIPSRFSSLSAMTGKSFGYSVQYERPSLKLTVICLAWINR